MAVEPDANVGDAPASLSPTSALAAALKANCSDWQSDDAVLSLAQILREDKMPAAQIAQRILTEQNRTWWR